MSTTDLTTTDLTGTELTELATRATSSGLMVRVIEVRCVVATVLMAAVLLTGFFVTRRATNRFHDAGALIELVGRQRMLLNLAGLLTERLLTAETRAERTALRKHLRETTTELANGHQFVHGGGESVGRHHLPAAVYEIFLADPHRLDARMNEFILHLQHVQSIPDDQLTHSQADVKRTRAIATAGALLAAQDAVVQAVAYDSKRAHAELLLTNWIVLGCGLVTLAGTGLVAFWPMVRQVRGETTRLEQTNSLLDDQKQALSRTLVELQQERDAHRERIRAMVSIMEDLETEQAALKRENQIRQEVQEKLQASEHRFYGIIESAPTAMVKIDREGKIILVNEETEKLFGYRREELLDKKIELLVPARFVPDHPKHRDAFFDKPARRRMGEGRDLYGLRKDGSEFPVEIGLNPIETDQGLCVLSAIVDITERKRAEAEIQRINEELRQKNDEMQQFVYTVSHDLKSPLVTCKGFVGLMKEDASEGRWDDMLDSVSRIERATQRMSDLIDDLLQLSRIGVIRNEPERVDVAEVLASITGELSARLEKVGASLTIQNDIPTVVADRVQLVEVFENLIGNAIKYGCTGDAPKITIGGEANGREVRYFVRDNGPGIAPEFHEKVFELFQRLESDKNGTGVGLAAVARIMEIHGGRAGVDSQSGEGASFWVAFPV